MIKLLSDLNKPFKLDIKLWLCKDSYYEPNNMLLLGFRCVALLYFLIFTQHTMQKTPINSLFSNFLSD
jgi:hypothetical protein